VNFTGRSALALRPDTECTVPSGRESKRAADRNTRRGADRTAMSDGRGQVIKVATPPSGKGLPEIDRDHGMFIGCRPGACNWRIAGVATASRGILPVSGCLAAPAERPRIKPRSRRGVRVFGRTGSRKWLPFTRRSCLRPRETSGNFPGLVRPIRIGAAGRWGFARSLKRRRVARRLARWSAAIRDIRVPGRPRSGPNRLR